MAFNDYQYIGYTDERIVTTLILQNLSRVMKAKKDREKWLDSLALQMGSPTDAIHVQGSSGITKAEQKIEQQECDPILKALNKIEMVVMTKIKMLSPKEQIVISESYLNAVRLSISQIAKKYGMKQGSVKGLRSMAFAKLTAPCVKVYKDFCLWRAYDDKELQKRIQQSDEEIKKELKKKLGQF